MTTKAGTHTLFGLLFQAETLTEATLRLANAMDAPRAQVVVTPNVDHLVRLDADPALKQLYAKADFFYPDGMPIVWASRIFKRPLPERVTGADLFVRLCEHGAREHRSLLLVGGQPGQEDSIRQAFQQHYPGLTIHVIAPAMGFDPLGAEAQQIAHQARQLKADLIAVCLGFPRQERWALEFAPTLERGVVLCVGAAMEFAIGLKPRAPGWVQRSGLEWIWRLASDPRRLWRRYLVDDRKFLGIFWREWRIQRQGQQRP